MQGRTYRYFKGKPLHAFGYGLSYSTFAFSNLKLSASKVSAGDSLAVEVDVRNTSDLPGDEVAELYLTFPPLPGVPVRALRGFNRVHLLPGEARHLTFTLNARDLSVVNESGEHIVAPGDYTVFVGDGEPGESSTGNAANFAITGEIRLPR